MRHFIFFYFLLLIPFLTYAKVWTVSNDPARPAQFNNLQSAIDASSPSDTLRIAGSATTYSVNPNIYFKLVFIGEGANNPNGQSTKINANIGLLRLNSSLGSSGSKFYGIEFTANISITPSYGGGNSQTQILEDYIFERCVFLNSTISLNANSVSSLKNVLFRNCLFKPNSNINLSGGTNLSAINFTNCIFDPNQINGGSSALNGALIIRNCIFLNYTSPRFVNTNGAIVENCIFYKSEPTGLTNSVFNNNITYLCNANTIPYGNNAGSGNLINVNPLFINYPPLGANFDWAQNYGLQAGSPATGTGANGTNIGLTGGNAPFNSIPRNSRIPVITNITLPTSSVPIGGTLDVNIQAISRN